MELDQICRMIIDDFYADYEPGSLTGQSGYQRTGDMYNVYKISLSDKEWRVDYNASYMEYHPAETAEIIFANSFERGWHGGAYKGENHPDPGKSYWKMPPDFHLWWPEPAPRRVPSPYVAMYKAVRQFMKELDVKYENEIIEPFKKICKGVEERVRQVYTRRKN